ncbi:MAG TPA: hypothetical protein VNB54_01560 [Alphaproteobacteria bacterium]|nr:hypothetical protein [Alphaproteobacteria bacterium]
MKLCQFLPVSILVAALSVPGILAQQPGKSAPTPAPAAKRIPQAKTQAEYADYNASYALNGGATVEQAANDFAAKYPSSELRVYLYLKALHEYQSENNPAKMVVVGEKVLSLDPDNAIALVLTATVLADSLSDGDQDREQKIAEIRRNSNRAFQTVDSSFVPPANATPEQIAAYKATLLSMAHSALGIMELKTAQDASAEQDLRTAANLNKTQPDPYIWYHLALAQDHLATAMTDKQQQRKKYADALSSANQALQYTSANPDLGKLAAAERDRLVQITSPASSSRNSQ